MFYVYVYICTSSGLTHSLNNGEQWKTSWHKHTHQSWIRWRWAYALITARCPTLFQQTLHCGVDDVPAVSLRRIWLDWFGWIWFNEIEGEWISLDHISQDELRSHWIGLILHHFLDRIILTLDLITLDHITIIYTTAAALCCSIFV